MYLKSILCASVVVLAVVGCSANRDIKYVSAELQVIEVDSMPDIKILSEIRVRNNQVYLTYESKGEYGQRHLKQYVYITSSSLLVMIKNFSRKMMGAISCLYHHCLKMIKVIYTHLIGICHRFIPYPLMEWLFRQEIILLPQRQKRHTHWYKRCDKLFQNRRMSFCL